MLIAVCKLFGFDACRPFKSIFRECNFGKKVEKDLILLDATDTNEIGRIPSKT